MTVVNWYDILDIRVGHEMASALVVGDRQEVIFNRMEVRVWEAVGVHTYTFPDWATGFAMVIFSGGGGGRHGDGGNNTSGRGGTSSEGLFGSYVLDNGSSRAATITIGSGGIGGSGNSSPPKDGSLSRFRYSPLDILREPNPGKAGAAGGQNGTTGGWNSISDLMARHLDRQPGSSIMSGPAGTGNGGSAKRGAGGAGGNGGIFGSYSNGGWGGAGFCEMIVWGLRPD